MLGDTFLTQKQNNKYKASQILQHKQTLLSSKQELHSEQRGGGSSGRNIFVTNGFSGDFYCGTFPTGFLLSVSRKPNIMGEYDTLQRKLFGNRARNCVSVYKLGVKFLLRFNDTEKQNLDLRSVSVIEPSKQI